MQIYFDVPVYSHDNQAIGRVKEVIVDPRTCRLTDLVVQQGLLFPDDQLIAAELVDSANAERILLRVNVDQLRDLVRGYEQSHFVDAAAPDPAHPQQARPRYWIAPPSVPASQIPPGLSQIALPPDIALEPDRVMLMPGSSVETSDAQLIGRIHKFYTDAGGTITHLLIKAGGVYKQSKCVPVDWIISIDNNCVHLAVDKTAVDQLPGADQACAA